jgi:predicted nucleic acid-binding Zn ribbon protein
MVIAVDMRTYLFRCKSCGHEIWSQLIAMNTVACEKCTTVGQWIVIDFINE